LRPHRLRKDAQQALAPPPLHQIARLIRVADQRPYKGDEARQERRWVGMWPAGHGRTISGQVLQER
jgi:hypothetical protein